MITITFNNTTISAYIFEDDDEVTISVDNIVCPEFIIEDMNSSNATIHTGVTIPEDWAGGKYFFDGTNWTVNESWVELEEEEYI